MFSQPILACEAVRDRVPTDRYLAIFHAFKALDLETEDIQPFLDLIRSVP